tara:strand:- start:2231 stop:2461 length:231 start_codon:yes stop_codon:yes gene_type:complete
MSPKEKWPTIKEMVKRQAALMEHSLLKDPSLKENLTTPTFIKFNMKNWSQLKAGKSIIVGISGNYMKVCRMYTKKK